MAQWPPTYVFCVSFNFDVGRKPMIDVVTNYGNPNCP